METLTEATFNEKLEVLAKLVSKERTERLKAEAKGTPVEHYTLEEIKKLHRTETTIKDGTKYVKIDIGGSGMLMIDKDGNIFGIKAYGVIHRGKHYGTLDTIDQYYWGDYSPSKITLKLKAEFLKRGYTGNEYVSSFSKEAQEYIIDRHNRGIAELKAQGKYPKENKDNGYTALLGVWFYTKSKGIDCAIGLNKVWMASLLNNDLI